MDGSKVIAYILPGSYNDYLIDIKRIIWNARKQLAKQNIPVILQYYGRGDHGGGPRREEVENIRKWNRKYKGIVRLIHGCSRDFFNHIEENYPHILPIVEREDSCLTSNPFEKAKYEAWMGRWSDISDGEKGVAVIADSPHGFSWCNRVFGLTLLRSPSPPYKRLLETLGKSFEEVQRNFKDVSTFLMGKTRRLALSIPLWIQVIMHEILRRRITTPIDHGSHEIKIYLYPHKGCYEEGEVPKYAIELSTPIMLGRVKEAGTGKVRSNENPEFLRLEAPPLVDLSVLKPSEEGQGYIVRVFNFSCHPVKAKLILLKEANEIYETDLEEKPVVKAKIENNIVEIRLKPLEIKTFLLQLRIK
jgi:alpha-mannosidase